MKLLFDNVNFTSRSGPNSFGVKLARQLAFMGHKLVDSDADVQLSFIQATKFDSIPLVQRLDGIWFNKIQPWRQQNLPIQDTYRKANAVIVQSEFNRVLTTKFFGEHKNVTVIRNGTDIEFIQSLDPLDAPSLVGTEKVWVCASSWRPHKRLSENIRFFLENSGPNDCLIIAGANPDVEIAHPKVFYAGDLDYPTLCSLYRAADYFLHLAWLDHCPNVVVDARAAGATIICTSAGGTREIAGPDAIVIEEDEWNFEPCDLYNPPKLDFTRRIKNNEWDTSIDIVDVSASYEKVLKGVLND